MKIDHLGVKSVNNSNTGLYVYEFDQIYELYIVLLLGHILLEFPSIWALVAVKTCYKRVFWHILPKSLVNGMKVIYFILFLIRYSKGSTDYFEVVLLKIARNIKANQSKCIKTAYKAFWPKMAKSADFWAISAFCTRIQWLVKNDWYDTHRNKITLLLQISHILQIWRKK